MKKLTILALFSISLVSTRRTFVPPTKHGSFHIKLFKCEFPRKSLEELFYPNRTCFARSYSRTVSTMNGHLYFRRPIHEGYISGELFYKYGTIYREVMNLKRFNVCQVFTLARENILIKQILTLFEGAAPGLIHECPYTNVIAYNVTFPSHLLLSVFPHGDYKCYVRFYTSKDGPEVSNITVVGTSISPIKESFGKR